MMTITRVSPADRPAPVVEKIPLNPEGRRSPIQRMKDLPTIQLFASTYCNLKCPYCSQGQRRKPELAEDFLSDPALLRALEQWQPTHFYVSGGEPLLHPGLTRFLQKAAQCHHYVSFDTNGVVPTETVSEILDVFPHEQFGFFNISHHLLAGVKLGHITPLISRLKQAGIPHFVKYIGAPESIGTIRDHMRSLQKEQVGVAVTLLETYANPWRGRHLPRDYSEQELRDLLELVTLDVHGMQFFGGIESQGLPCSAGYRYFTLNMREQRELCACCHRSDPVDWKQTVFLRPAATKTMYPCTTSKCLGDLMFIIGCQGLGDEIDRFEQVCRGISPPVGIESVLRYTKAIAQQRRLVLQDRFDAFCQRFHSERTAPQPEAPCAAVAAGPAPFREKVLSPESAKGTKKLSEYLVAFHSLAQKSEAEIQQIFRAIPLRGYYYDQRRWPGWQKHNQLKYFLNKAYGFPMKFNVEVATQCVFKCEFCVLHSGRLAQKRTQRFLRFEDFARLFLQIQPFVTHVEFTGGEPLLNADLGKMVRLCNDWSVKTVIATNAKLLDEKRIDALLTDPPSELLVAYETGQVEAYEKHRRGGNLELLVHNIKGFVEERNRRGQPSPRVKLQTVVSRETVSHMEEFWRDAELLGVDEACSKPIFVWPDGDDAHWEMMKNKYLIPNHALSYYRADAQGRLLPTRREGFCPNVENVHIGAGGEVVPCWYNLLASPSMGNALTESFVDIWFSPTYDQFRQRMVAHTAYEHGCKYCIGVHDPKLFEIRVFTAKTESKVPA